MTQPIASRMTEVLERLAWLNGYLSDSEWSRRRADPAASDRMCDFVAGNPHEMPLRGVTEAIQRHAEPKDKDWYAYKLNEEPGRSHVVDYLGSEGLPVEAEDVFLTPGAFGAITVSLRALCDPGDEVVYISPPWFFYEAMIAMTGAVPVKVKSPPPDFDLPVEAIAAAITPRTRAVIVNSPHNPSGRIYPDEQIAALAGVLEEASARAGRAVYLLSDESYRRILFDGATFSSPAHAYDRTVVMYTLGKTLLAPGERIGFIALPTAMPDREQVRAAMTMSQVVGGWQFANAILQRALGDLMREQVDLEVLGRRRDRLVEALTSYGYEVTTPRATFYIIARSPIEDDVAFCDALIEHDVFCLPGYAFDLPGYFRISITANDDMVERGLPGFKAAIERVRA